MTLVLKSSIMSLVPDPIESPKMSLAALSVGLGRSGIALPGLDSEAKATPQTMGRDTNNRITILPILHTIC
mgnify:FL=1